MDFNKKLILSLSFGCVILSKFVDTNDNSNFNPSYSSIQSVVTLNGGAQNRSSETIPVPPALEQNVKVSKNSSSSVSNSKTSRSTPQPGNKIRYFLNENPGGSGLKQENGKLKLRVLTLMKSLVMSIFEIRT